MAQPREIHFLDTLEYVNVHGIVPMTTRSFGTAHRDDCLICATIIDAYAAVVGLNTYSWGGFRYAVPWKPIPLIGAYETSGR